jgi:hypothetical protein
MNHWEELRRELQGSRGFAAWVRRQVIPQGAQLADEARQQVLRNLWKDIPPSRDEILRNVNTLFCDFLDTEYVLYLQYEEQCALMAIELALSEHAQRHYPKTSQLIRSTLSVLQDSTASSLEKLRVIADHLRLFYRLFEQSLAQGRMTRAGGSAQLHLIYLLEQLGYAGELETQQVLNGRVDFVFPSKRAWELDRQRCVLVSVKRSLRERYKQIFEELGITGGLTVYLVINQTLGEARKDLTSEKVDNIRKQNVYLVVRDAVKAEMFPNENSVLSFSQFITEELPLRRLLWRPLLGG